MYWNNPGSQGLALYIFDKTPTYKSYNENRTSSTLP